MVLDKKVINVLTIVLVISAFLLAGLGGIIDMTGSKSLYISKEHAWSDSLFLLGLAILLNVIA